MELVLVQVYPVKPVPCYSRKQRRYSLTALPSCVCRDLALRCLVAVGAAPADLCLERKPRKLCPRETREGVGEARSPPSRYREKKKIKNIYP